MKTIRNMIVVAIILIFATGIVAGAIPIDKKETLGPYGQGHRYYIKLYNIDDLAQATVNGKMVVETEFTNDSGWVDITDNMEKGKNVIEFDLYNWLMGWSYAFEIRKDDSDIIFKDTCGTIFVEGCMNNDLTKGLVYRNVITVIGTGIHIPKH